MKPYLSVGGDTGLSFNIGWFKGEDFALVQIEALTVGDGYTVLFALKVFKFCITLAYFK